MPTPLIRVLLLCCLGLFNPPPAKAEAIRILVLGDSLTAGYGLPQAASFPAQLEVALRQRGFPVQLINAGVSGDTSMGGLSRLDWVLVEPLDLVIVELGANDALRGLDPATTRQNLSQILHRLQQKQLPTILAGMKAPRNLGVAYYSKFDSIYPDLARQYELPLYPFFLAGVAGKPELNQVDGIHPTASGVARIVQGILPMVEQQLNRSQP